MKSKWIIGPSVALKRHFLSNCDFTFSKLSWNYLAHAASTHTFLNKSIICICKFLKEFLHFE